MHCQNDLIQCRGEGIERNIKNHTKLFHPDIGVDLKEGGITKEPGDKPSKHGRDQLQQLYSHEFQFKLRINTGLYLGGHPSSYNPVRPDLTWNSEEFDELTFEKSTKSMSLFGRTT